MAMRFRALPSAVQAPRHTPVGYLSPDDLNLNEAPFSEGEMYNSPPILAAGLNAFMWMVSFDTEHAVEVEAHHLDPRTNAVLVVRFLDGVGIPAPASYVFNFGARSTPFTIDDTAADVWGVFRLHFSFLAGTTQPTVTGRLLAARRDARAALCTAA